MNELTVHKRANFDLLCWVCTVAGLFCLGASLPASLQMVEVAHNSYGAYLLLVVLELVAFFALLAPLWVPTWEKDLHRIAYTLLTGTTIGNFAAGWDYLWARKDLHGFWLAVRNWEMLQGFYPLAILTVLALAAAVPFGMKFFVGLAIKRYRENELENNPKKIVERAFEPFRIEMAKAEWLNTEFQRLGDGLNRLPMLPPTQRVALPSLTVEQARDLHRAGLLDADRLELVELRARASEGEQGKVLERGRGFFQKYGGSPAQTDTEAEFRAKVNQLDNEALWAQANEGYAQQADAEEDYTEAELNCKGCFGPCGRCHERNEPPTHSHPKQEAAVDAVLPEEAATVRLDEGEPNVVCHCEFCGEGMTAGAKGVATKQAPKFEGRILCTSCRKMAKTA